MRTWLDLKASYFSTTLTDLARQWFQKLEPDSIHSFEDLYQIFIRHLASSRKTRKVAMSLMDIRQEPQERLREYTAKFNIATLEVPDAEAQLKGYVSVR